MPESGPGGYVYYKCRRCGKVDFSIHAPDLRYSLSCVLNGYPHPEKWGGPQPTLMSYHHCDDQRLGVVDLIGGNLDAGKEDGDA